MALRHTAVPFWLSELHHQNLQERRHVLRDHINAFHEQDWSDADQISRGIEPQFWTEREPAAPEHQARSRSPRSKSVFGINLDKMSRDALMDLRRAVDGELAKRR